MRPTLKNRGLQAIVVLAALTLHCSHTARSEIDFMSMLLPAEKRLELVNRINENLRAIRETGCPVNLDELDAFYAYPENPDDNAAAFYERAFRKMQRRSDDPDLPLFGQAEIPETGEPLAEEMRRAIEAFLDNNTEAIDLIFEATRLPSARFEMDLREGYYVDFRQVGQARNASRLLSLRILSLAEQGAGAEIVRTIEAMRGLSHAVQNIPTLMGPLTGTAIAGITINALMDALSRRDFSDEELTRIDSLLDGFLLDDAMARALCGERAMAIDVFRQVVFSPEPDSELIDEFFGTGFSDRMISTFGLEFLRASGYWLKDFQFYLERLNNAVAIASLPPRERFEAPEWRTEVEIGHEVSEKYYFLTAILGPYALGIFESDLRVRSRINGARLALRLEKARVETGSYPDSLADVIDKDESHLKHTFTDEKVFDYTHSSNGFTIEFHYTHSPPVIVRRAGASK